MKLDEFEDSDLSENEEQYSKLANAVSELDNTHRIKAPTRRELSTVVSEFHLPKGTTEKDGIVHVNELAGTLSSFSGGAYSGIGDRLKSLIKKGRALPKPLEKPVAERIQRAVGYENVKGQLKKWNAVVAKNRSADHLSFPLQQGIVTLQSSEKFLNKFKNKTPLEIEMAKILQGKTEEELRESEKEKDENVEFPLTLEEMLEKRKELAQIRAKLSYQEAKARRQSKIKSKKYHRILKRQKIKEELKEFEMLQKSNPEAALKKLEELDKNRALERASLRHRNTGKWAKSLAVRAKYDKDSRKILAEQLKISRDLTEKIKNRSNADEEESDQENSSPDKQRQDICISDNNPWALKVSSEVEDFVTGCKKYWENKNKEKMANGAVKGVVDLRTTEKKSLVCKLSEKSEGSQISSNGKECSHLSSTEKSETKEVVRKKTMTDGDPCETSVGKNGGKPGKELKNKKNTEETLKKKKKVEETLGKQGTREGKRRRIEEEDSRAKRQKTKDRVHKGGNSSNVEVTKKETIGGKGKIKNGLKKQGEILVKDSGKQKSKKSEKLNSTSGPRRVLDADEVNKASNREKKNRENKKNIDELFDDLEEKLLRKTMKKVKKIKTLERKFAKGEEKKRKQKKEGKGSSVEDLTIKKKPESLRPVIDEELEETTGQKPEELREDAAPAVRLESTEMAAPAEIDPKKFVEVKPKNLNTKFPDNLTGEDNYLDDEEKTQMMDIVEAFNEDDVMEEFQEMKKEEEESTKLEVPDALPGWGAWGGADIDPSKANRRRKRLAVPKLPPRKDHDKKDMIIRENANLKVVEHMVKEVPHPFKSVGAFESNMRHPIGREWIPETAHRKFVKKPVETQLGTIIEPMDENELVRLQKERKSLYKGKKKGNK